MEIKLSIKSKVIEFDFIGNKTLVVSNFLIEELRINKNGCLKKICTYNLPYIGNSINFNSGDLKNIYLQDTGNSTIESINNSLSKFDLILINFFGFDYNVSSKIINKYYKLDNVFFILDFDLFNLIFDTEQIFIFTTDELRFKEGEIKFRINVKNSE